MVSESLSKRTALSAVLATLADAAISVTEKHFTLVWGKDGSCVANFGGASLPIELLFGCAVDSQVELFIA